MASNKKSQPVIVYVSSSNSGGMMHYTQNIYSVETENLDKKIVRSGVYDAEHDNTYGQADLYIGTSGINFIDKINKYNPFFFRAAAKKICTTLKPDIVHITSYTTGLLSLVSAFNKNGVKVVYTVHDPKPHEEKTTRWGRVFSVYRDKIQLPFVMRKLDRIHVHAKIHLEEMIQIYGSFIEQKIYAIQHGAGLTDTIKNGSVLPNELKGFNQGERFVLLFFGRLEEYKGLDIFIETLRMLQEKDIEFHAIIAGSGDCLDYIEYNDISNIIIINRFIPDNEIRLIFELSSVVILPYKTATQTGIIPIAYCFKKPVITTDVGALSEMVVDGETGWVVDTVSSEALYEIIERQSNRLEKLTEHGQKAYEYFKSKISWDIIYKDHEKKYIDVIES